ncbi:MAG: hypothetical protein RLZZ30_2146 [Bacteroidota bacterium]
MNTTLPKIVIGFDSSRSGLKEKKRGVSYSYRTAQPHTFATFLSWRIQRELVVKDLPRANVGISFYSNEIFAEFLVDNRTIHQ